MRDRIVVSAAAALVAAGCGGGGAGPEELDLASPSAACEQAFAAAAEAGERPAPASPRSPDIEALRDTLEACGSADEWLTSARGHRGALPIELGRADALDRLCVASPDTPVCRDWDATVEDESGP